jgi:D-amino-acid dehydrogenase
MQKHCVVIGAGIVGASCAWYLLKNGLRVTLVDHRLPGQSCSFGNAACIGASGLIPSSYPGLVRKIPGWLFDPLGPVTIRLRDFPSMLPWFHKFWRAGNMQSVVDIASEQALLMRTVLKDYDDILEATGLSAMKKARGAIHIYDTHQEYRAAQWQYDLCKRLGFESQKLSPEQLRSLVPCLKLDHGVGVMEPDWHHLVNPAGVTQGIAEHCFSNGGQWIQDRVVAVTSGDNGISLRTVSGRKIEADQLVVAAGAWSNSIAEQLDYRLPLIGKRGYHSHISEPGITLEYPVMSVSRAFVMTPLENGLRVAGTAEFARIDAKPDYRRAKVLLKHASHYLDSLNTRDTTEWMGHRPMMTDSKPVLSVSPRHANVFYAFGHGHYGITQGPTSGRLMADMVVGKKPSTDISAFRFDRFPQGW